MKLDEIRKRIDDIDEIISTLLSERLGLTGSIAAVKAEMSKPVLDKTREQHVLEHVGSKAKSPAEAAAIRYIYEQIMAQSRKLQVWTDVKTVDAVGDTDNGNEYAPFKKVAIFGLGLIGSALALQIRRLLPGTLIVGIDHQEIIDAYRKHDEIDASAVFNEMRATSEAVAAVNGCELIVLSAPPEVNLELLRSLASSLQNNPIVLDVASTKKQVLDHANSLELNGAQFIGGHPLFGSEKSGFAGARDVMVDGSVFCLIRSSTASDSALLRLSAWLVSLHLIPELIDAFEHDATLARTSHLVQLIATGLGAQLSEGRDDEQLKRLLKFSGPALRQQVRLMRSPPVMWTAILKQNRDEVVQALTELQEQIEKLRQSVADADYETVERLFNESSRLAKILNP